MVLFRYNSQHSFFAYNISDLSGWYHLHRCRQRHKSEQFVTFCGLKVGSINSHRIIIQQWARGVLFFDGGTAIVISNRCHKNT